ISTHPCTFSHPSARKNKNGTTSSVIAKSPREADGYLRAGNVDAQADALGNAAALDVHKFLSLVTEDGRTVLEHIENDSDLGRALLSISSESYDKLKSGFMAMAQSDDKPVTSSKIKQVYFPVEEGYHQLSILSNSGIIFELRKRIDALRFSDSVKEGREARRNNLYSENGYSEIFDVTTIGYGGANPQNISILNAEKAGTAHLLFSVPPILERRDIKFPKTDFFTQSLRYYDCKSELERLDKIFKIEREGNIPLAKIRKGRDRCLRDILDIVLQNMIAVRSVSNTQFFSEKSKLKQWQKIWLCEQHQQERRDQDEWLDALCKQVAAWINKAYKYSVKNAVLLGEAERAYIRDFVAEHKEAFR
ncbi:MAG: type I-F CRISPR-associated protein Csy1, partial [Pseudomonadales bacterium]|nr:type I-F CRISPR-associated protein Csy1 [Pseudomonadales bacterium]